MLSTIKRPWVIFLVHCTQDLSLKSSRSSHGDPKGFILILYHFEQVKVMEKIYTMVKSKQRNGGGRTASIKNTVELNTSSSNQTQQNQVGNGCCPTWKSKQSA